MQNKQVTIKDIARIAGVSFSTVSRCLNDSPLVAESTRKRIQGIADEIGFEFNSSARSLITSQSGTIGIILPENFTVVNVNVYHGMLMNNLRTSLEKAGVDLIVTYKENHFTGKNNIFQLVSRNKVDGLILLVENPNLQSLEFLDARQVPYVCLHFPPEKHLANADVIYTDHIAGGRLAAEHLIERGCRKLGMIAVIGTHLEFKLREQGFREAAEEAGCEVVRFSSDSSFESARLMAEKHIAQLEQCEGIFALNDLMAIGVMKALQLHGTRIPEDMLLVGYDDSEFSHYVSPTLSSIHQPKEELAVLACERLFYQIEKVKKGIPISRKKISIQPDLEIRESSTPPPRADDQADDRADAQADDRAYRPPQTTHSGDNP